MSEYVIRHFPEWREEILQLLKDRADFHEICEDYEELNWWLDDSSRSTDSSSEERDEARDLKESLEIEIMEILLAIHGPDGSEKLPIEDMTN